MRTAIIVPGVTDLNKGDQALVWESYRLVKDTELFDDIYVLSNGDTPEEENELCSQTKEKGIKLISNIIKHPRRGQHLKDKIIHEGKLDFIKQVKNASLDYISRSFLINNAKKLSLLKRLYSADVVKTVEIFSKCHTVFVKGGGFIHAHGERTAPYVIWYLLFYVNLAKSLGKKVVFLPNSYGPFEGLFVKEQVIAAFSKMELKLAREHISAQALGDLLDEPIKILPDLGFYLQPKSKEFGANVLREYLQRDNQKLKVGITIRPWRFPGKSNSDLLYEKYIQSIFSLVKQLVSRNYQVLFFNQSMGPNTHEDDRNAIRYLTQKLDKNDFIWVDKNFTCEELKSVYSNLDFFVGTRFHSVIFSMTSCVPSIAIAYGGNKGRGIMQDFNLSEYVIHIDDVNKEDLLEMFLRLEQNKDLVIKTLQERVKTLENKRIETIELIKERIL
ncbi:polysaccharide pyruvyl transferase family protein [Sphingobacterium hotanense]|uniref:polysaccharide pyruvyl transferase family protein n=1 Tax=Sphingobacterium hotanense TaxID=649196 RepID=UPI0011F27BDA|nr:polysaccharide pyruvyl transferase family protein [Sphingobacterium hotanense]